jgi:hypothetical protein
VAFSGRGCERKVILPKPYHHTSRFALTTEVG